MGRRRFSLAMLSIVVALTQALVLTPYVARTGSRLPISMKLERKPGEGDPFGTINPVPDAYGNTEESAPRMDVGIARWHSDSGYIEEDDEPWDSTAKAKISISKGVLETAFGSALPFAQAEEDLIMALTKVKTVADVDKAVTARLAAGGRPGCPAIDSAEKIKKAADGDAVKAGPAPKSPPQGKGWDGMARSLAKTHDNSI